MIKLYEQSGVNLDESEKLNKKLSECLDNRNIGMFAGSAYLKDFKANIVNCCDGIGSKIIPLYERNMFKTIAIDLIAANLNDMATRDAQAVMFSNYIAVNKLNSDAVSKIIVELNKELKNCGCILCGGETSEIPHLLRDGTIDICGFAVGLEENSTKIPLQKGDLVIGLPSSGIHANGFTLIRKLYSEGKLSEDEFQTCLAPSRIYYNLLRTLWGSGLVKSAANITGGGISANLKRVLPVGLDVEIDFDKIPRQPIFSKLQSLIGDEIFEVFNCGTGFCIIANPENAGKIIETSGDGFVFGEIV